RIVADALSCQTPYCWPMTKTLWLEGEWIFRQLVGRPGDWKLRPLNPSYPTASIPDLSCIKGVIIQKSKPGRRKAAKRYVE
ncbi:MAG: hypothetical protein ACK4N6_04770, partial [Rhodocyclaceae bacterium]